MGLVLLMIKPVMVVMLTVMMVMAMPLDDDCNGGNNDDDDGDDDSYNYAGRDDSGCGMEMVALPNKGAGGHEEADESKGNEYDLDSDDDDDACLRRLSLLLLLLLRSHCTLHVVV